MAAALCPSALSGDGGQGQQLESAKEARAGRILPVYNLVSDYVKKTS